MSNNGEDRGIRRVPCALFVDLDNVYLGLRRLDPGAAEAFASDPSRWLAGLETGTDMDGPFVRRFLVRNCYLNPTTFARYRPFYTRAGFRVVDCPSLTQQGKSSADIYLALDAIDALSGSTRYDEFVIVSADADFTPLALRVRAADRRVTVVVAGPAASAYRAVADTVVEPDALAQIALATGVGVPIHPNQPAQSTLPVAKVSAARDRQESAAAAVLALLSSSDGPVTGASVAQVALSAEPALRESNWDGFGSFAAWLANRVAQAGQSMQGNSHYVWDNSQYSEADLPAREDQAAAPLPPLARQVVGLTDVPALSTEQYGRLLTTLAEDVNAHPYVRTETSKRVRDACRDSGPGIGRNAVNFVIQGLVFAGVDLVPPVRATELARAWADNVLGLCRGVRMELDDTTAAEIRNWAGGGLVPVE